MGVGPEGAAVLAGQAKVTDLQVPLVVVQDVAGLQVPVDDPVVVQVGHPGNELLHQALDLQHKLGLTARSFQVSVNDPVVMQCAGALRCYLQHKLL